MLIVICIKCTDILSLFPCYDIKSLKYNIAESWTESDIIARSIIILCVLLIGQPKQSSNSKRQPIKTFVSWNYLDLGLIKHLYCSCSTRIKNQRGYAEYCFSYSNITPNMGNTFNIYVNVLEE